MLHGQWWLKFLSRAHALATQFVAPDLETPEISEAHILVPDAAPVRLVRLAHRATGTR